MKRSLFVFAVLMLIPGLCSSVEAREMAAGPGESVVLNSCIPLSPAGTGQDEPSDDSGNLEKESPPVLSEGEIIGAAIGGTVGWWAGVAMGIVGRGAGMNAAPVFSSLGTLAGAWLGSKIQQLFGW